jgi:hypothetical protein
MGRTDGASGIDGTESAAQPVDRTMDRDTLLADDDASDRQFWKNTLRIVWTTLTLIVLAGVLVSLTMALHWTPYLLLAALGTLAGLSLLLALLGSARSRQVTGFGLGVVALPLLAIWLSTLAATRPESFTAYSAGIAPFLAYATAAVCGGMVIERVWRAPSDHRADAPPMANQAADKGGTR